ncbi:zinc finger and BTB domain-containing protein 11-like [Teleopsis dalmanni]|uniref:zinc finger and BTB domain-containing protein 11-like n=1 Tax=Teleopsis dalmanni TaxID=139649 RepID=UPI0018CD2254|nr:zinc finger and BTB domain-containing protein 11-like [Teleopsis dalmanni]
MPGKRCKICCSIKENCMSVNDKIIDIDLLSAIQFIIVRKFAPSKLSKWSICQECAVAIIHADVLIKKLHRAVEEATRNRKRRVSVKSAISDTSVKSKYSKSEGNKSIGIDSKETESAEKQIEDMNASKIKLQAMNGFNSPNKIRNQFAQERTANLCELENSLNDTVDFTILKSKKHNSTEISTTNTVKKSKKHNSTEISATDAVKKSKSKKAAKIENSNTSVVQPNVGDNDLMPVKIKKKKVKELTDFSNVLLSEVTEDSPQFKQKKNKSKSLDKQTEKQFVCEVCCKSFRKMSKLQDHIKTAHIENPSKDCPNCGLSFKSQSKFDKHVFSQICQHSIYSCQQSNCNRMFSKIKDMKKHMENTHAYELSHTEEVN